VPDLFFELDIRSIKRPRLLLAMLIARLLGNYLFVPARSRDDCALSPSTCHFLIKETADPDQA